jgi:hypothetical protein
MAVQLEHPFKTMSREQMTLEVRIRCGRCKTVDVADVKGSPIRIR